MATWIKSHQTMQIIAPTAIGQRRPVKSDIHPIAMAPTVGPFYRERHTFLRTRPRISSGTDNCITATVPIVEAVEVNAAIVARPTAVQKLGATLSAKAATPNSRICPIMVAKVQRESGRCAIQRHAAIVPAPTAPASHENPFAPYPENIIGEAKEEFENRSAEHGQQQERPDDRTARPVQRCKSHAD